MAIKINESTALQNGPDMSINGTAGNETLAPIQETESYKNKDPVAYDLSKQYYDSPRRLQVIVAGAGCSGLDFAHTVESGRLKNIDLKIYEKNAGLGGTWWENRYPGCACDIPSHNYLVRFFSVPLLLWLRL